MSRSGILVSFRDLAIPSRICEVGDPARVMVELPLSPGLSPRCLECMTEVTRVTEGEPGNWWMSFRIRRTRVVDREDTSPAPVV